MAAFQESFPGIACIRTTDDLNLVVFGKTAGVPVRTEVVDAARRFTEASALSFDLDRIAGKLNITCTGPGWVEPP